MVFEGFQQRATTTRARRSWVFVLSVAAHGGLLFAGVVYSFWHVDELKMPSLTVTFVSGIPQAAPPPPAALGGGATAKKTHATKTPKTPPQVAPKTPVLTQPEERPKTPEKAPEPVADPHPSNDVPKAAGPSDTAGPPGPGIANGTAGGDPNSRTAGGVGTGPSDGVAGTAPRTFRKFLPPTLAAQQKVGGSEPEFPAVLRRPGARYLVGAKICVGADGRVETIDIVQAGDPTLDARVREAVKGTWHYRPYTANGTPVPFCYRADFNFRSD